MSTSTGRHHGRDSRATLVAAGKTIADVRAWALAQGIPVGDRGLLSRNLVNDYLATLPEAQQ